MEKAKALMDLEKKKNHTQMQQQQLVLQEKIEQLVVEGEQKQVEYQARLAKGNELLNGLKKEGDQPRRVSMPAMQVPHPSDKVAMTMHIHRLQRAQQREEEGGGTSGRRVPLRERIARARCVWCCVVVLLCCCVWLLCCCVWLLCLVVVFVAGWGGFCGANVLVLVLVFVLVLASVMVVVVGRRERHRRQWTKRRNNKKKQACWSWRQKEQRWP